MANPRRIPHLARVHTTPDLPPVVRVAETRSLLRLLAGLALLALGVLAALTLAGCGDEVHLTVSRGAWVAGVMVFALGCCVIALAALVAAALALEHALRAVCRRLCAYLPWGGATPTDTNNTAGL